MLVCTSSSGSAGQASNDGNSLHFCRFPLIFFFQMGEITNSGMSKSIKSETNAREKSGAVVGLGKTVGA